MPLSPTRRRSPRIWHRYAETEWVVYAKRPFGGPQAVLAYLSRYTHRVAIANSRLIAFDRTGVTFRVEGLSRRGSRSPEGHDTRHRRVHPPLPDPRPAATASTASATTACSPAARAPTTSPERADLLDASAQPEAADTTAPRPTSPSRSRTRVRAAAAA